MSAQIHAVQALPEAPGQEGLVVEVHTRLVGARFRHARQVRARGGQRHELHELVVGAVAEACVSAKLDV